jgi:septal ring factor EnvC (AmiA/AmiB activator)
MSDTPRTDKATRMAFAGEHMVPIDDAQKLERELAYKRSQINRLIAVIKSRDTDKAHSDKRCNELRDELVATRDQRAALASALWSLCRTIISGEPQDITDLLKQSGAALAAVKGGSHE